VQITPVERRAICQLKPVFSCYKLIPLFLQFFSQKIKQKFQAEIKNGQNNFLTEAKKGKVR